MIKKLIFQLIIMLLMIATAFPQENASSITTGGKGRIEVVSWSIGIIIGKSYEATIPSIIEEGTYIPVSYLKDGKNVLMKFPVDCIKYRDRDKMCWVYSKCRDASGDTLYINNCRPSGLY